YLGFGERIEPGLDLDHRRDHHRIEAMPARFAHDRGEHLALLVFREAAAIAHRSLEAEALRFPPVAELLERPDGIELVEACSRVAQRPLRRVRALFGPLRR